jgi:hypothetical protein
MKTFQHTRYRFAGVVTVALLALAAAAPSAGATAATATLTGGSLAFVTTPAAVAFPSTALNGLNQSINAPAQPFDVGDATGSAAGWNITATSTQFLAGALTLPTAATTLPAPATPTCDGAGTCTLATPATVTYPYSLPAATTAPTATRMYSATVGTGIGNQTLNALWALAIPASARAGAYASVWTLSLVSGP